MKAPEEPDIFLKNLNKRMVFRNVYDDGILFVNPQLGSKYELVEEALPFLPIEVPTTSIGDVLAQNKNKILMQNMHDIKGQVKWIGERKFTTNDNPFMNCVVFDATGSILCTVWKKSMLEMRENEWLYLVKLGVEDYFGIKMQSTSNSSYMTSSSTSVVKCPDLNPYFVRVGSNQSHVKLHVDGCDGIGLALKVNCSKPKCGGDVKENPEDDELGVCARCKRDWVLARCKKTLCGEVDIDTISLKFGDAVINSFFGTGTAQKFQTALPALKKKILLSWVNVMITYEGKSKIILNIAKPDEEE